MPSVLSFSLGHVDTTVYLIGTYYHLGLTCTLHIINYSSLKYRVVYPSSFEWFFFYGHTCFITMCTNMHGRMHKCTPHFSYAWPISLYISSHYHIYMYVQVSMIKCMGVNPFLFKNTYLLKAMHILRVLLSFYSMYNGTFLSDRHIQWPSLLVVKW